MCELGAGEVVGVCHHSRLGIYIQVNVQPQLFSNNMALTNMLPVSADGREQAGLAANAIAAEDVAAAADNASKDAPGAHE